MFSAVLEGHGVLECDEEAPLQRADELDVGAGAQVRLADPAAGSASLVRFSPNEIVADVDVHRPVALLVNQNWNEHFTVEGGALVRVSGRLAAQLEPGRRTVTLRYRSRAFTIGAALSLTAAPLLLALFVTRRRTRYTR